MEALSVLEEGQRLGHLQVLRPLARGGMGEVYLARDLQLGRKVAVKLIRHERRDAAALDRFREEARTTARFNHPNIVTVHGFGEHDGQPYVVMEFLEGPTLRERLLQQGKLAPFAAARIGLALAGAISEAHRHGIIHRDLKPENIILPVDGRPRVLDFGLASSDGDPDRRGGTPGYMSPEQWLGAPVTAATDVWALGAILFELTTGRRPFEGDTAALLRLQVCDPGPSPTPALSGAEELAALIGRCLEKTAARRPPATEVAATLERILDQRLSHPQRDALPYRGLLPFGEEDAARFFGREAELAWAQERLRTEPALVVVGPSGAGKSSFVHAGILPRLRESGPWTVIAVRPGADPFGALAAKLCALPPAHAALETTRHDPDGAQAPAAPAPPMAARAAEVCAALRESPARLSLILGAVAAATRSRVLLLVDQLEELATQADSAQTRAAFLQTVLAAADDPVAPVRVVATVRDDFVASLDRDSKGALLSATVLVLGTPAAAALEEILTRPLSGTGFSFEDPALVSEMVRAVAGSTGALPLLSFTASALWDRRDLHRRILTRAAYADVGGVVGALAEHADRTVTALGTDRIGLVRELFLRLVGADGTRRTVSRSRLLDGLTAEAGAVLGLLIESRLVVSTGGDGADDALEIVHEALSARWRRLQQWVDDHREGRTLLEEVTAAAQQWRRRGRRDEDLWDGLRLQIARETFKRTRLPVSRMAQKFVTVGLARAAQRAQIQELERERNRLAIFFLWMKLIAETGTVLDGVLHGAFANQFAAAVYLRTAPLLVTITLLILCRRLERARAWIWYSLPLLSLPMALCEAIRFWRTTADPAGAALDTRAFLLLLVIGVTFSLRPRVILITGVLASVGLSVARWMVIGPDVGYVISTNVILLVATFGLAVLVRRLGVILGSARMPGIRQGSDDAPRRTAAVVPLPLPTESLSEDEPQAAAR